MSFQSNSKDDYFSSILMELTLQYAELTDAHTFLLVETPSSRRYAGKKHLIDLYVRGGLKPCGKDSEIIVDSSLSQMIEVKNDGENGEKNEEDKEESPEVGSMPRRHIGELPSERRQRMKNERKTYNKLVNMTPKSEDAFGAFLMEALMKYSCKTDTSVFFLIETNHGRRFCGTTHLCDQYLMGDLRPTGDDVEVGLDVSIKVVTERRIAKPKDEENDAAANLGKGGEEEDKEETNGRKRKESGASMDSSDQPVKRRQAQQHVGLLPSERREKAKQEREAKYAAEHPEALPPPPPPASSEFGGDSGRKHKGELPSERRERLRREREAADYQYKYAESGKIESGPGYICGPSNYTSSYDAAAASAAAAAAAMASGYNDAAYGWGQNAGGYDAAYASSYGEDVHGYKSSYGNWKSGGTIQSGAKTSKSGYG